MFDKTIQNAEQAGVNDAEKAGEKLEAAGEAQVEKVIKIGVDWADTHRLKLSFSGNCELFLELVPKQVGPHA